jgi:SRSO17 transposase
MPDLLRTLLDGLEIYRPALTEPGFRNLVVIFAGWVLTSGQHAVTQALVMTSVAGRRHHERFHRFFSRGTWDPDKLGWWLFQWVLRVFGIEGGLRIAIDDTLAPKKGPKVFGIGSHLDAVRSTRAFRVFCFGHCWVVLAVLVTVPFSRRPWALPILFRLYRSKKECRRKRQAYRKKTELAGEMLGVFRRWVGGQRVELAADAAYCNHTVTRRLPDSFVLLGSMRPDAVLTALPDKARSGGNGGRRRKRGDLLPKPEALANDGQQKWKWCEADLYGHRRKIRYKEMCAQWYRACGVRLLRVVVVQVQAGTIGVRVFFSTDPSLTVRQILEGYAGRWSIETCFKNMKQLLGFADSSARKRAAVQRVAPFVGLTYTFLVAWFTEHAHTHWLATPPIRPWYRQKVGFAFSDVLRTAQRVLAPLDVLDPSRCLHNLHQLANSAPPPSSRPSAHPLN